MNIFAFLGLRALGDFILINTFASSIKCGPEDKLTAYFINDRPYKQSLVNMNPHVDFILAGDESHTLPINYFDNAWMAPVRNPNENWYTYNISSPDLILVPSMIRWLHLGGFESPARLQVKPELAQANYEQLIARGLNPKKWFCTLHAKEAGYVFRKGSGPARDVDPRLFEQLATYIIDKLGGQVVRLGDPSMTPFAKREGLIDLSREENIFELQATAVQLSRFLVATDSGIHPLGSAFGTPTFANNILSPALPWNAHDLIKTKRVLDAKGQAFENLAALEAKLLDEDIKNKGYTLVDNSMEELTRGVEMMYENTKNPKPTHSTPKSPSRSFQWPPKEAIKATWLD